MKRDEMHVGMEVGVVPGEAKHERRPRYATKAVVKELGVSPRYTTRNRGVRVEYLDERPAFGSGDRQPDDTYIVSSRQVWLPWEDIQPILDDEKVHRKNRAEAADARAERLVSLQEGLVKRGLPYGAIEWAYESDITPPTRLLISPDDLEALLNE